MTTRFPDFSSLFGQRSEATWPRSLLWFALLVFNAVGVEAAVVQYGYDSLNRLTNVNYGNSAIISYTYDAAGNRLTYSGVVTNDAIAPTIAITNPTSGPTFATTNGTINLSGTAADNTGVSVITWVNYSDYNTSLGTASGTISWNINSIPLYPGDNFIFVTAYDLAGNSADAGLTVTYTPHLAPTMQFSTSGGSLNLSWPETDAGFTLQYANSLSPPILWSNVVATVTTNSGALRVTLPTTNAQRFFRLQK